MEFTLFARHIRLSPGFFGLVFLASSFGYAFPWIGPDSLIVGWAEGGTALTYMERYIAGVQFGIGYWEWIMADQDKAKDVFTRFHIVLSILFIYSSIEGAVGWLRWLYPLIVVAFTIPIQNTIRLCRPDRP